MQDYRTGKYLLEALILASTKPKYDKILFIELRLQYMKSASSEHVEKIHVENMLCTQISFFVFVLTVKTIYVAQHVLSLQFSLLNL